MKPGFVYLFFSVRFLYFKIGLSGTPKRRLRNVRETVKDDLRKWPIIIPIFVIAIWDMDAVEDKIHTPLKKLNFTWVGSGKTEWHKLGLFAYGFLLAIALMVFYQIDAVFKTGLLLGVLVFIIWIIRNV